LHSRSSSLSNIFLPKKSLIREKSEKKITPSELRYKEEFKKYLDVKNKKEAFIEGKKKLEKDNWDKYTKGLDSPNKKAFEMKEKSKTPKEQNNLENLSENIEISMPIEEHEAVLNSLTEKEKGAFIMLRNMYNNLDNVFFVY